MSQPGRPVGRISESVPRVRKQNSAMRTVHRPVLLREAIEWLALQPGQVVVDGTVGAGGHGREILTHITSSGTFIGLDRDPSMLRLAAGALSGANCHLRQASYARLPEVLDELSLTSVDRILLDLGFSSDQLADESRGFAFEATGPLDLRFDPDEGEPAWKLIETLSAEELTRVFEEFGEEPHARRIAGHITRRRRSQPIRTARELAQAVAEAVPAGGRKRKGTHPATRVFQALRSAVNAELEHLQSALGGVLHDCLKPGGRLVVITFHSLEDRLVKQTFRDQKQWDNLTPRPITPAPAERRINPRSRSAKLRAAAAK